MLENYEGSAIDTEVIESVQSVEEPDQTESGETVEPQVEEAGEQPPVETEPVVEEPNSDKVVVDGLGEFTVEELKEWKQAGLRQADYTRKTQELARQREEAKDALELMAYLRQNPHLVEALKNVEDNPNQAIFNKATPENEMLMQLAYNQKSLEIDMKLNQLKAQYGDVDEVALFQKATELKTDDFEFVYKALMYDRNTVDKQKIIDEAKEQLRNELEANKDGVKTVVGTAPPSPVKTGPSLTEDQKHVANAMGLTEAEYLKWMG